MAACAGVRVLSRLQFIREQINPFAWRLLSGAGRGHAVSEPGSLLAPKNTLT
jgi:hypothetical protein